jgi:hypothetical protein
MERVVGAREEGEGSLAARVGLGERELQMAGVFGEQRQRVFERELFDRVESDVLGSDERELEKSRAGEQDGVVDAMIGEPGLVLEREAGGEDPSVTVGEGDGCAEERMVCGDESCGRDVGVSAFAGIEPDALALESVGRKVDSLCTEWLEEGLPIDMVAAGVQLDEGEEESGEAVVVASERADDGGGGVRAAEDVVEGEGEDGMRTHFDEEAVAVGQ